MRIGKDYKAGLTSLQKRMIKMKTGKDNATAVLSKFDLTSPLSKY